MYFQVLTYLCLFINGFPAEVQCKIKTEIYQNVSQYDIQKLKAAIYQMSLEIQQRFWGIISLLTAKITQKKAVQENTVSYRNDIAQRTLYRQVPTVSWYDSVAAQEKRIHFK